MEMVKIFSATITLDGEQERLQQQVNDFLKELGGSLLLSEIEWHQSSGCTDFRIWTTLTAIIRYRPIQH